MKKIQTHELKDHLQKEIIMQQDELNKQVPILLTSVTEKEVYFKTMDYKNKYGYISISECENRRISFHANH